MAAAAVLALFAAGGFVATVFGQRPLQVDGDGTTICMPRSLYSDVAVGTTIRNTSKSPLTLTSIDFGMLDGLDVKEAWVIPREPLDDSSPNYGVGNYPPTDHPDWVNRVPLKGAVIEPEVLANIVLRVTSTEASSGASAEASSGASAEASSEASAGRLTGFSVHYIAPGAALGATESTNMVFKFLRDEEC
jgi:hypothetical protein